MTTPAREVRAFNVTVAAGTTEAAPSTTDIAVPVRVLTGVYWRVPPGPAGLFGWRLSMSGGVAVLPTGGGWIIADDQSAFWPVYGQPDSGAWQLTGYNDDIYDHTVYLEFLLDLVGQVPVPGAGPASADLSSPASAASRGVSAG